MRPTTTFCLSWLLLAIFLITSTIFTLKSYPVREKYLNGSIVTVANNATYVNELFHSENELFFALCGLHHSNESYSKIIIYSRCQPLGDTVNQPDKLHVAQFIIYTILAMLISYHTSSVSWYNKVPVCAMLFLGMYLCVCPLVSSNLIHEMSGNDIYNIEGIIQPRECDFSRSFDTQSDFVDHSCVFAHSDVVLTRCDFIPGTVNTYYGMWIFTCVSYLIYTPFLICFELQFRKITRSRV